MTLDEQLEFFCRTLSKEINVQRVGVWVLSTDGKTLTSRKEWDFVLGTMTSGTVLREEDARTYLQAIKDDTVIVMNDAMHDPRCVELALDYLPSIGISSMLDFPLYGGDGLIGVLCIEHIGPARTWSEEERNYSASVASMISLGFETQTRREAEESERSRERRMAAFTEMAVDRFWETDENLIVNYVTSGRQADVKDAKVLIGKVPWEVPGRVPLLGTWDTVRETMERRQDFDDLILYWQEADGTKKFHEVAGKPQFDLAGVFTGYLGVSRDVSKRLQNEAELRAGEQRYRNASKLARLGHWIWDRDEDKCSFCSSEMAEVFGVTAEEFLARSSTFEGDLKWFHPDDRERYKRVVDNAVENQTGWAISVRIIRDDGEIRHIREWAEAGVDDSGRVNSTMGVLLDVTEQVELNESLQESRTRLANIVDNLPGAIFRVKVEEGWPAIYRSEGYFRLFVDPDINTQDWGSTSGKSQLNVSENDRERIRIEIDEAIKEERPYEIEFEITTAAGEQKWVWERGMPIKTENGNFELEGILIDATDRRIAENALIKSQRGEAIGQLTGGIAHDFNNLLAVIMGNLELLRDELNEPAHHEMLDAGIDAAVRGADLTKSMLAFASQARLEPSVLELNEVVQKSKNWIVRTLPTNIEVNTHLAKGLWQIKADPSSTESALLNLILNARDSMVYGGKITIETTNLHIDSENIQSKYEDIEPGHYVMLGVSDTGHGIPQGTLNRVFEPFFTTKGPGAGSGLGLSMIHGFMRQSGGTVRVYSEVGVGTTFKLYFNALVDEIGNPPGNAEFSPLIEPQTGRILVAEDELGVLNVLVSVLQKAGHRVVAKSSGDAAKAAFDADPNFDLLITDIVMPGILLGPGLARELRQKCPDLPVIFLTGYASEATVHGNGLRPEDVRLMKPIRRLELLANIEDALTKRKK